MKEAEQTLAEKKRGDRAENERHSPGIAETFVTSIGRMPMRGNGAD
jgi:hypothetical protein